jgi:hypothetical protein
MVSATKKVKHAGRFAVFAGIVVALALVAPMAGAVSYNPATSIVVYVHGFDNNGWTYTNTFGDDDYVNPDIVDPINQIATFLGRPTNQSNPVAPNQVCGATYYGTVAPTWYTSTDIAEDNAAANRVPKYALRMAKYIKHVMDRSGAASAIVLGGSFGGDITRYMIEKNLCSLSSDQKISRWMPIVGVVRGNWAASSINYDLLGPIFGENPSPDIDNMKYSWITANVSANTTMNSAYFAPMLITQFCATDDGDGYITALNNNSNDGTNMTSDEYFAGYSTTAALHAATDGTLMMPGTAFFPTEHTGIVDHMGMWAGVAAAASNNVRVTIKLSRFKALKTGDNILTGNGEWVYRCTTVSPRAQALYGVTAPMCDIEWENGVSPKFSLGKNATVYPNSVLFDMVVPPAETGVTFTFNPWELDNKYPFYNVVELGSNTDMGTQVRTISTTANSVVTVIQSGNYEADFTTTVKNVY